MTVNHAINLVNLPFRSVWSILGQQKGLLTCTALSPSGVWVVSGSQDGAVVFVDHKAGALVGRLNLESKFYATAAIWRSDTVLIFGCSNGVVYHLDFEHKSRRPVSVHALISPLKSPVRSIAFDTFRDMLAIAFGGEVRIYVWSMETGAESWDCVDHVLAPCTGTSGLVTALCFFGNTLSCRHLFIDHAKAGWTVWLAPRSYHRTPFMESGDVCSIGSATIPPSEQFIAIATLDNSLVTYLLRDGGPAIETQFEGTVVGNIDVLDPKTHSTALLHHAPNQIIRTLNAYGDKLVVGSSDLTESSTTSCLRCYTFSSVPKPRDWRRIDGSQGPIFEITLSSVLSLSERIKFRNPLGMFSMGRVGWFELRWRRGYVSLLVGLLAFLLALASSPPSRAPSILTGEVRVLHSQSTPPQNPTLSTLVMWYAAYLSSQLSEWVIWLTQTVLWVVKLVSYGGLMVIKNLFFALNSFVRVVFLIPRLLKETLVEVPDILANLICDILRVHGFDDVCPK